MFASFPLNVFLPLEAEDRGRAMGIFRGVTRVPQHPKLTGDIYTLLDKCKTSSLTSRCKQMQLPSPNFAESLHPPRKGLGLE